MVLILKALVSAAIVLGSCLVGAAPARADPTAFSALSCDCQQRTPGGGPAEDIQLGIRAGLNTPLPRTLPSNLREDDTDPGFGDPPRMRCPKR